MRINGTEHLLDILVVDDSRKKPTTVDQVPRTVSARVLEPVVDVDFKLDFAELDWWLKEIRESLHVWAIERAARKPSYHR